MTLLSRFLAGAAQQGIGRVKIIHGKGIRSPDGFSVVRDSVKRYLETALKEGTIRDFRLGNVGEGGSGVTIVWL